jgi:glycosyltransferase involved in cell wall biosynthesis
MNVIIEYMEEKKVAVVLLTWQRIVTLRPTLKRLFRQTYTNFDIIISNSNPKDSAKAAVNEVASFYNQRGRTVIVRHDSNDLYAFRRFQIGKDLYDDGYEIVLFIDDDIRFPDSYIEKCLSQYEPKTYKSGFTWILYKKGINYYKFRKRVYSNEEDIHYAGTGISMIDASIFADKNLIDSAPKEAYTIEDVWLSYFVIHKEGWSIKYMETPNVIIGGADAVALYKVVQRDTVDKADFLRILVDRGWEIPEELPPTLVL